MSGLVNCEAKALNESSKENYYRPLCFISPCCFSFIWVLSPILEERIPRKCHVLVLDVLPRSVVKPRRFDDLFGLLGCNIVIPIPCSMFLCPFLNLSEVPACMCRGKAWHDDLISREIDPERNGSNICMAHERLSNRVHAMIYNDED